MYLGILAHTLFAFLSSTSRDFTALVKKAHKIVNQIRLTFKNTKSN